ncbi:hypothetical protein Tco_0033127 [Tanacetum coccineum]
MTQAEQRNYMMNYVRSQGHGWTIPQLKKLSFEELKVETFNVLEKSKGVDVEDIPNLNQPICERRRELRQCIPVPKNV